MLHIIRSHSSFIDRQTLRTQTSSLLLWKWPSVLRRCPVRWPDKESVNCDIQAKLSLGTYGRNLSLLWLREYIDYDRRLHLRAEANATNAKLGIEYAPSYQRTPAFLIDRMMEDKHIVHWHKDGQAECMTRINKKTFRIFSDQVIIDQFVFLVVCHGERSWYERADFAQNIRALIDEYPQFQVSLFDYDATIFDLNYNRQIGDDKSGSRDARLHDRRLLCCRAERFLYGKLNIRRDDERKKLHNICTECSNVDKH